MNTTKSRKEIKEEYKRATPRVGVFEIRNTKNGKRFIAHTMDLDRVWNSQKFQLEMNGHRNEALQEEWNEFGEANFLFEVIHELKPSNDPHQDLRSELRILEELTIEELQPFGEKGYLKPKRQQ